MNKHSKTYILITAFKLNTNYLKYVIAYCNLIHIVNNKNFVHFFFKFVSMSHLFNILFYCVPDEPVEERAHNAFHMHVIIL